MKKKKLGRVAQLKHKEKKYKFKVDETSFSLLNFSKEQRDRYSPYKISWFPEKLRALQENRVTPPKSSLINPTNKCNQDCFLVYLHIICKF